MPFYRNLGAIRFQSEIKGFEIFRAEPDTTIFQGKQEHQESTIEALAHCYQLYLHNHNIQYYQQQGKGAAIVIPNSRQAHLNRATIDELCQAMLEAVKVANNITAHFPTLIGDFSVNQFRTINGRLAFVYLPTEQVSESAKMDIELVKGFLKLGGQLKDESNLSHRLLLKKLAKCKTLNELSQEIHYFYSVYGVGSKSTAKPLFDKPKAQPMKKRDNKRKLNLFNMGNLRNKSKGNSSCYSLHSSSAPKRNNSLNISLPDKARANNRTVSNSCSTRNSPFNPLKFKTINFNSSFHSLEGEQTKSKKSLRKTKPNGCESIHTPVSLADQQKLMKKLHTKKTESSVKKIDLGASQKEIPVAVKSEKQMILNKIMKESAKPLQSPPKLQQAQANAVSIKFPSKHSIEEPMELAIQSRMNSSKTIHKHQSIHVSLTAIQNNIPNQYLPQSTITQPQVQVQQPKPQPVQPQPKKLKKKPVIREQQWGSELEIVDFTKKQKQVKQAEPKVQVKKPITKESIKVPKISIDNKATDSQEGQQTRKNSWKSKPVGEETVRNSSKYQELLQKKQNLDYMGKTVVNTSTYLKNYEKIFWELPLFFLYRSFYIMRIKLAREVQVLQQPEAFKTLVIENDQIGQAVSKLIKVVTRKLKKQDPDMLKEIKDYLNIEENYNCDSPMKSLLGQYIQSLTDASQEYPQLMKHEIEVVNSYLIAKGQKIDQQAEQRLQSDPERRAHLNQQLSKLAPFL